MPTERFFRLPREKIETIKRAAIEEFKRVSPEEASINKIIQTAEISRGSFYTYFEDKYDLLRWLLDDFIEMNRKFYMECLKENGGNIWDVFEQVFSYTTEWVEAQGLFEIVGNMMKGNQFFEQFIMNPNNCEIENSNKDYVDRMYEYVSTDYCRLNREEFGDLVDLHMESLIISLKMYFIKEKSLDEIEASYRRCIKLLRYGGSPCC